MIRRSKIVFKKMICRFRDNKNFTEPPSKDLRPHKEGSKKGNLQKQMNYGPADKHRRPVEQEKNKV